MLNHQLRNFWQDWRCLPQLCEGPNTHLVCSVCWSVAFLFSILGLLEKRALSMKIFELAFDVSLHAGWNLVVLAHAKDCPMQPSVASVHGTLHFVHGKKLLSSSGCASFGSCIFLCPQGTKTFLKWLHLHDSAWNSWLMC